MIALIVTGAIAVGACSPAPQSAELGFPSPAVSQPDGSPVTIVVRPGATGSDIARELAAAGVVPYAEFYDLASSDERSLGIQPGSYSLRTGMTAVDALEGLLNSSAEVGVSLSVEPGERVAEVAEKIAQATGTSVDEVLSAFDEVFPEGAEGRVGVATYPVLPGDTPVDLASRMRDAFSPTWQRAQELANELSCPPEDLLIIASILPNEVYADDWGKASRVIENRLAAGMPLQLDSTVAYASGVRRLELTVDELGSADPYNTYTNKGLPPGPIGAVSVEALEAAANPEVGTWLYWVTVDPDTGETVFATSYEDFLSAKDRYREWLAQQ